MRPCPLRLTTSDRGLLPHQHYLYSTLLDTLAIPYTEAEGSLLLWPEAGCGEVVELAVGNGTEAFAALARLEERRSPERDDFGRFPLYASEFADDINCPVDTALQQLVGELEKAVRRAGGSWQRGSTWPADAPFAVCLTHDVDWLRKWSPRRLAGLLFTDGHGGSSEPGRETRWRRIAADLQSAWRGENPNWNLVSIASREREFGFRSTFFVMAGRWHRRDGDYDLDDPKILRLLEEVRSIDSEIGLHGSYLSYRRPDLLAQELERLRSVVGKVSGVRQHYLRLDVQSTLKMHESLGFEYDSTLAFAEHEGYRSGFSYPYFPYFFDEMRPLKVLEIPLTVMDATLFRYRRLTPELAWLAIKDQLEYVKGSGGCCTLLWHNNYFDEEEYPGYGQLYWRALAWIAEHGGWASSACEIAAWWRSRAGRHI